jgi:hypothetical protein
MNHFLAVLLTFATAVHTVFGCCGHHAPTRAGDSKQNQQVAQGGCLCHSHSHADEPNGASPTSEPAPASPRSEDGPARDHQCHGAKCVSVLSEKAPDLGQADLLTFDGAVPAVVTPPIASVDFATGFGGHFLAFEAVRPIRTHLLLRVLLI